MLMMVVLKSVTYCSIILACFFIHLLGIHTDYLRWIVVPPHPQLFFFLISELIAVKVFWILFHEVTVYTLNNIVLSS